MRIDDRGELRIQFLDPDGPLVATTADALDLIGDAWGAEATAIAIPVARLDPAFFDLRSGVAGEIAQKLVQYRFRLIVVGDVSAFEERGTAFRDWVREANRGHEVWFVPDETALDARLA